MSVPALVLTSLVLVLFYPSANTQRGFLGTKHKLSARMNELVRIQRVKESILRGLNMTNAPPAATRQITSSIPTAVSQPVVLPEKQIQVIFSEARDDERPDLLTFKLDSGLVAKMDTIKIVYLQIQFKAKRPIKRNRFKFRNGDNEDDDDDGGGNHEITDDEDGKKGVQSVAQKEGAGLMKSGLQRTDIERTPTNNARTLEEPARENSMEKENSRKRNRQKKSKNMLGRRIRKMRRFRRRRVKVVVKVVDTESDKKRKFAVEKFDIKRNHLVNIPIPLPLLGASAAAPGHSLTFQIICKRCKKGVRWESVYKLSRNKRKLNRRRLNPNRPMLYIESKDEQNKATHDRRKRDAVQVLRSPLGYS